MKSRVSGVYHLKLVAAGVRILHSALLLSVCGPVLVELLQFVGISLPPHFYFYADARFFPFPTSNAPRCVTDRQAKVAMFREHRLLHRIQVQECSTQR